MRVEHNFPLCPSIRPRSPTCDDLPWHSPGMLWLNCWTYFRSAFVFRHIYFLSCLLSQPSPWAQRGSSTSQSEASAIPQDYRMIFLKCETSAVRLPNLPYRIRSQQGGPWGLSRLELNCLLRTLTVLKANRSGAQRWASPSAEAFAPCWHIQQPLLSNIPKTRSQDAHMTGGIQWTRVNRRKNGEKNQIRI